LKGTVDKMKIVSIHTGDILVMKKPHPCQSFQMEVLRVGSDIRIRCLGCGHDVTVPRIKLEKNIKSVLFQSSVNPTDTR
jgi:hypothetical protein